MEELRSIILLRKVLPAGTTLAAKLRVPMREKVERLDQLVRAWRMSRSLFGSSTEFNTIFPGVSLSTPETNCSKKQASRERQEQQRGVKVCAYWVESGVPGTKKLSR